MFLISKILFVLIIPATSLLSLALSRNAIRPSRTSFSGIESAIRMSSTKSASSNLGDATGTPPTVPAGKEFGSEGRGFKKTIVTRSKNLLIIGLGNPGSDYDDTRHNVGFRALDEFAAANRVVMKFTSKFNADYGAFRIGDKNVGLLKPSTYINNSGGPIKKIMENFKLSPKDILIIADDIALECGDLRLREKGSHGGHNGHRGIYRCFQRVH
jgi:Peptidyl-tRNA hydrolase